MKNQKGINIIAIIIGVVVGLLIVGIVTFFILSGNNENENKVPEPEPEPIIEETEISIEEKNKIKDNYLNYFASIAMTQIENLDISDVMVNIAISEIYKDMENIGESTIIDSNISNNLSNTLADINSVSDDTNTVNNIAINDTSDTPKFPDGTNIVSNVEKIEKALFEMFNEKIENLSQLLQNNYSTSWELNEGKEVIKIEKMEKINGIYTAIFDICTLPKDESKEIINVYGLDCYTIKAKFQKNENAKYSEYQLLDASVEERNIPIAYHLSLSQTGLFGVVDNNGNEIIKQNYSKLVIPNTYIGLFICYKEDEKPLVLNEKGVTLFKDYDSVKLIEVADNDENWTEQGVLIAEKNGLYGLIDFYGNIIYEPEYDEIVPLGILRERIILVKNNEKMLADISGNIISNEKFAKIGVLGIDFEPNVMVTSTRTEEEVISMMVNYDYVIGLSSSGTYSQIEKIDANEEKIYRNTIANIYENVLNNSWQLYSLSEESFIPVYMKIEIVQPEV